MNSCRSLLRFPITLITLIAFCGCAAYRTVPVDQQEGILTFSEDDIGRKIAWSKLDVSEGTDKPKTTALLAGASLVVILIALALVFGGVVLAAGAQS